MEWLIEQLHQMEEFAKFASKDLEETYHNHLTMDGTDSCPDCRITIAINLVTAIRSASDMYEKFIPLMTLGEKVIVAREILTTRLGDRDELIPDTLEPWLNGPPSVQ